MLPANEYNAPKLLRSVYRPGYRASYTVKLMQMKLN